MTRRDVVIIVLVSLITTVAGLFGTLFFVSLFDDNERALSSIAVGY